MEGSWVDKPLADLMGALRAGAVSPLGLYAEARDRHERLGPRLGAYRVWDETGARGQAERAQAAFRAGRDYGPLQGIPVSAKDLFGVAHLDTFAGSPRVLPEKWREEGAVMRAVLGQNGVLAGKTHMVEFAFGGVGTNAHWPVPRNPWDAQEHRVPGGSSSGAGVSLLEGSAVVALGTDTAGSVRVPAAITGTVGLKVTAGRWPTDGIVPLSPTFDTPGILTRSVADAAVAFEAIDAFCAGRAPRPAAASLDPAEVRIGVAEDHFWERCDDGIARAVKEAIAELERAGAKTVAMDLPGADEAYSLFQQGSIVSKELRGFLESELPGWMETLDPDVALRLWGAVELDEEEIERRHARMEKLAADAAAAMEPVDVVIAPTVPVTAPRVEDVADPKAYAVTNKRMLSNTFLANMFELCAITLPVALDGDGLPVGLQCMAACNAEERLLSIALGFEEKLGTARERLGVPPLAR